MDRGELQNFLPPCTPPNTSSLTSDAPARAQVEAAFWFELERRGVGVERLLSAEEAAAAGARAEEVAVQAGAATVADQVDSRGGSGAGSGSERWVLPAGVPCQSVDIANYRLFLRRSLVEEGASGRRREGV